MKYLLWLLKAAIFFTLFAFALNNQHDVTVNFFFGAAWRAPLVLVVLAACAGGLAVGVLGMLPGWWRHRKAAAANQAIPVPDIPGGPTAVPGPLTQPGGLPSAPAEPTTIARHHGL